MYGNFIVIIDVLLFEMELSLRDCQKDISKIKIGIFKPNSSLENSYGK
jgi:hypothetical protein